MKRVDYLTVTPDAPTGVRIWYAMKKKGIDEKTLARLALTNQSTVSQWIRGKYEPRMGNALLLAKALDVSLDWLLGGKE